MSWQGKIRHAAKRALRQANLRLFPFDRAEEMARLAEIGSKASRLAMVPDARLRRALDLIPESQSQLNQDFFVLEQLGWKRDGYFVEFGATNGRSLSNTWLLEKAFGWSGILAEPGRMWRVALENCGRRAALEFDCVWSRTGETLEFAECGELSTIGAFEHGDHHVRHASGRYAVQTVSLTDLLERHHAPAVIDYLSIDTEGSELEILSHFDFGRYRFRCVTCEHNHTAAREPIHALLASHGYRRRFEELSEVDDWYVHEDG